MAVDIVCGKDVDPAEINAAVGTVMAGAPEADPTKGTKRFHDGKWYYFCSLACRQKFKASPEEFMGKATA